jgi:hypothetical protein
MPYGSIASGGGNTSDVDKQNTEEDAGGTLSGIVNSIDGGISSAIDSLGKDAASLGAGFKGVSFGFGVIGSFANVYNAPNKLEQTMVEGGNWLGGYIGGLLGGLVAGPTGPY